MMILILEKFNFSRNLYSRYGYLCSISDKGSNGEKIQLLNLGGISFLPFHLLLPIYRYFLITRCNKCRTTLSILLGLMMKNSTTEMTVEGKLIVNIKWHTVDSRLGGGLQ